MSVISTGVLPTTTLETFRARAAGYDRENRFFQEDFDDLRQAGYLRMAVPKELGGLGFSLADVARETRRLASYAPATALGTNMVQDFTARPSKCTTQAPHWLVSQPT